MIGEAFGPIDNVKSLLGENQDGLNFVFLFDMIFFDFNAKFFREITATFQEEFPSPYNPTIVYSNHDNYRSQKRINNSLEKAKVLAVYQMTARGLPVVYYGEEIGIVNAKIKKKDALDTLSKEFNQVPTIIRKMLPVPLNRDIARTPMQWNNSENGSFTQNNPWLKTTNDIENRNVKDQLADSSSLLNVYKNLLSIRSTSNALKKGTIEIIDKNELPKNVLAYTRKYNKEELMVLINFSSNKKKIKINRNFNNPVYKTNILNTIIDGFYILKPYSSIILKK